MNRQIITGLALATTLAIAPAANALPLVDFGIGAGMQTFEDDESAGIAVHGMVDLNIPATPFSVEGMLSQTVSDGEMNFGTIGTDYSGNQLGAFFAFTTPTPMVKIKAKAGLVRSNFDFESNNFGSANFSGTELGYGLGVHLSDWQFDWTRTSIEDGNFDQTIDYLNVTIMF